MRGRTISPQTAVHPGAHDMNMRCLSASKSGVICFDIQQMALGVMFFDTQQMALGVMNFDT